MEDTTIETALKTFEDFYLKKDYPNALLSLEKLKGELSPGVWHYNVGTVEAQMQHWPQARYHFLMAEEKGNASDEVLANQKIVEEKLELGNLENPLNTSDYLIKGSLIASQGPLTTISLGILVFGIWLLKKKASIKTALLVLVLFLAPLGLNFWIKSWPRKIVLETKEIHDGPSNLFGIRGELPPGLMVLTNTKGEWEQVIFPSRFNGWIRSDKLKRLE